MAEQRHGGDLPGPAAAEMAWGWRDLGPAILVALAALAVRVVYAGAVVGPPIDDPAYYVTVAQNMYAGQGFTSRVIWQYSQPFDAITHPAGEFWMPLASWLIYGSYRLLGLSWPAAQAPGVLAGSGLAVLAYAIGWRQFAGLPGRRGLAAAAGLLVGLNGVLAYQSASADSSAPFALLAALALWIAGRSETWEEPGQSCVRRQAAWAALCGLLTGMAYLARSDGAYLVLAMCAVMAIAALRGRTRVPLTRWLAPMLLAAGVLVLPWLLRNLAAFGTPFPAPASRLMFLTRYEDLFNYLAPPSLERWLAQGLTTLLAVRGEALWHNWHDVLDFLFFPSVLLPIAGLMLLKCKREMAPVVWFGGLLLTGTALVFPVAALAGTFYHDAGALAPFLAVGSVWAVKAGLDWVAAARKWRHDLFGLAFGTLLAVVGVQLVLSIGVAAPQHEAEARRLAGVAAWLKDRPGAVVISAEPYNLSYQTRAPALMLPAGEGPEAVLSLAHRYGASYVVLTRQVGVYPAALAAISPPCEAAGQSDFCLAMRSSDGEVYAVR